MKCTKSIMSSFPVVFMVAVSSLASATERATPEQVLPLMKAILEDKTLVGDDQVVQKFGPMVNLGTLNWIEADVESGGNTIHVVDSLVSDGSGKAILVEQIPSTNSTTNYFIYITAPNTLLIVPSPDDSSTSNFVSRECWVESGESSCQKMTREDDGTIVLTRYRQQKGN